MISSHQSNKLAANKENLYADEQISVSSSKSCKQNNLIKITLMKSETGFAPHNTHGDAHAIKKHVQVFYDGVAANLQYWALWQMFLFVKDLMLTNDIKANT